MLKDLLKILVSSYLIWIIECYLNGVNIYGHMTLWLQSDIASQCTTYYYIVIAVSKFKYELWHIRIRCQTKQYMITLTLYTCNRMVQNVAFEKYVGTYLISHTVMNSVCEFNNKESGRIVLWIYHIKPFT